MSAPVRVQLSRKKGWRMRPNTVSVARPTKFGNPFPVIEGIRDPHQAVRLFRMVVESKPSLRRHGILRIARGNNGKGEAAVAELMDGIPLLRGKNLACWRPLCDAHKHGKPFGQACPDCAPCHADVLLEMANAEDRA